MSGFNLAAMHLRATLAWDDREGSIAGPHQDPRLINDLDLVLVSPDNIVYQPWYLNTLPQDLLMDTSGYDPISASDILPAVKGVNTRDNVEVVDANAAVDTLPSGRWKLVVKGASIPLGKQDFSVVSDYNLTKATRQIGWLWIGSPCPEGRGYIHMDDEDDANGTQSYVKTGYSSTSWSPYTDEFRGIWKAQAETGLEFCRESRDTLPRIKNDYAVLSFSDDCPVNSIPFARFADNEDDNNQNTNSGAIEPSYQYAAPTHGYTYMRFCFVRGDSSSTDAPWLALGHGALSDGYKEVLNCPEHYWHIQDDEDIGNTNYFDLTGFSTADSTSVRSIFGNADTETHYFWNSCF
jgi:hypothetical protein